MKSESIVQITKAILQVMKEVKGVDKSMTVGSGSNAYKGVSDKDVKIAVGRSMEAHGLCIIPVDVEPTIQIDRWEEVDQWSKETPKPMKQKQSVLTTVKTKYLLLHESGEYIELSGYGHGVDTQDKAAGKATTYALKYALLYTFMVPTGTIDDADNVHSDEIETPKPQVEKPWLNENTDAFTKAVLALREGTVTVEKIEKKYKLSKQIKAILQRACEPVNQ